MSNRNIMILAALVAVLGAFIFFIERHQPTTDERLKKADRVFPGLDESAVVGLELRTDRGSLRLEQIDDEWRLLEPLAYPADASAVRSAIQAVAALDSDRTVSIDEISPGDYGLENPSLGIVLVDEAGGRFELSVGGETPLGSKRAVRRGQEDEILFCSGAFVSTLDRDVDDWRSRDVVDVLENDLAAIEIEIGSDRISVTRAGERWVLNAPVADLADSEQMRSLISELNALRISEFLDANTEAALAEALEWETRIELRRADESDPVTLELAAPADSEPTILCRRNGEELFRVPEGIRTRLGKAPVLWRSDKVWPFSTFDVGKIEISSADAEVVLDKADGLWRFEDGVDAETADVRRRLTALADLEVREHDLLTPPTEVMGSVILVLDDESGAEGLSYTFYAPIELGGYAAVRLSSRGNIMGVDAAVAEMIVGDLDRLRPTVDEASIPGGIETEGE